jgi:hypothetical protein
MVKIVEFLMKRTKNASWINSRLVACTLLMFDILTEMKT